jgi:hypothetical protein
MGRKNSDGEGQSKISGHGGHVSSKDFDCLPRQLPGIAKFIANILQLTSHPDELAMHPEHHIDQFFCRR